VTKLPLLDTVKQIKSSVISTNSVTVISGQLLLLVLWNYALLWLGCFSVWVAGVMKMPVFNPADFFLQKYTHFDNLRTCEIFCYVIMLTNLWPQYDDANNELYCYITECCLIIFSIIFSKDSVSLRNFLSNYSKL